MKRVEENNMEQHLKALSDYVSSTPGLSYNVLNPENIEIHQLSDKKAIKFELAEISDVLSRSDSEGQAFIQVNFKTGKKILLTGSLIGFKPAPILGLDLNKLPKVVTTPDLISVFEAIEDAVAMKASSDELETLKKVFNSILAGGELIGFDLAQERQWLWCLMTTKATA